MSQTPDASSNSSRSILFLCLGVVLAAAIGVSSRAFAFTNPSDYGTYPTSDPGSKGFGAGRYFTGSPADGYSCEVCHSSTRSNYSFPLVHKGLPLDGYVPGQQYKIEITWPEATNAYTTARAQGFNPIATLVAEFVAEDGGPAGTVAFANNSEVSPTAYPNLYCDTLPMAAPGEEPQAYAMEMYVQDTGSLATLVNLVPTTKAAEPFSFNGCTVERGKDADGNDYERRCIIAMRGCGAQRVKFTWTAPEEWRGPIWFSAGFVTTYDRSTAPNDDDFVSTLSIPLNPGYKGGEYVNELKSGCSVAYGPRHSASGRGFALMLLSLLGVAIARRRQRRAGQWALVALALCCIGCDRGEGLVTNVAGTVGAYESSGCTNVCDQPIECRESAWPDAGTAEEAAAAKTMMPGMMTTGGPGAAAAGSGAAGAGADPGVKSLGSITAQFVTAQPPEYVSDWVKVDACAPIPNCMPHYVAAWIDVEQEGRRKYVRTLLGSEGMFRGLSLVRYYRLGADCQVPPESVPIDVMAAASLYVHQPHTVTWDGLYGSGHKAAEPGLYHLRIEVAIDEAHHFEVADIPFMFGGPAPTTETSPPQLAHTGVTISYTPSPP